MQFWTKKRHGLELDGAHAVDPSPHILPPFRPSPDGDVDGPADDDCVEAAEPGARISPPPSSSTTSRRPLSRPVEEDAGALSKDSQPDGIVPSAGVELYERMGATLPPLPPEKPFTGKIDEAYGDYQRGLYETALSKALTKASAGDAPSQTLVATMMMRGFGIKRDAKTPSSGTSRRPSGAIRRRCSNMPFF